MLTRSKRIRRVSKKTRQKNAGRRECCAEVRDRSGGWCECKPRAGGGGKCWNAGQHFHERLPRSAGGSITDKKNVMHVCSSCHRAIHEQPLWAKQNGYTISRYPVDSIQEMKGNQQ